MSNVIALQNPSFVTHDRIQHQRRLFAQIETNSKLWADLTNSDHERLRKARLEFNRCKGVLLANAERGTKAKKVTSFVQRGVCAAFFCYRAANFMNNPASYSRNDLRKAGLQMALMAIGMANPISGFLPLLASNAPRIALCAIPLLNLNSRVFDFFTTRSEGLKEKASQHLKFHQQSHKEDLRLGTSEVENLDKLASKAYQDENESHRLILEALRSIKSSRN